MLKCDTCGVIAWLQWSLIPVFDVMILTNKPWPGEQRMNRCKAGNYGHLRNMDEIQEQ